MSASYFGARDDWDCEAYGPDARAAGALCFIAGDLSERVCGSPGECRLYMAAERRRVFDRIRELAAGGDETAAYLAGEFTRPEQLLGGETAAGHEPCTGRPDCRCGHGYHQGADSPPKDGQL